MNKMLIAAATFAAAALPLSASAQPASQTQSIAVSYADLDLGRAAGRAVLARRIRHAIAALCGDRASGTLAERMAAARCARETSARADAATALTIARARAANRLAAR